MYLLDITGEYDKTDIAKDDQFLNVVESGVSKTHNSYRAPHSNISGFHLLRMRWAQIQCRRMLFALRECMHHTHWNLYIASIP